MTSSLHPLSSCETANNFRIKGQDRRRHEIKRTSIAATAIISYYKREESRYYELNHETGKKIRILQVKLIISTYSIYTACL